MRMHNLDPQDLVTTFSVVAVLLCGLHKSSAQDFSYEGVLGPEHWREKYQTCDGKYQSPINIDLVNAQKKSFPELVFNGFDQQPIAATMTNNGHTVVINMDYVNLPEITGGPLNDSYQFAQFHFHWGDNDTYGSEDLINNRSYPIELHMVFYKAPYGEFDNALNFQDGLVVLAYFYEVTDNINPFYDEFLSHLDEIPVPGLKTIVLNPPKLQDLVWNSTSHYFTYRGSLTTPPCSEVVTWIDFDEPIPISPQQIMKFRNLYSIEGEHLTHNFRPVQPLNGRIVYLNVPSDLEPPETKSNEIDLDTAGNDLEGSVLNAIGESDEIDDAVLKGGSRSYTLLPIELKIFAIMLVISQFLIKSL